MLAAALAGLRRLWTLEAFGPESQGFCGMVRISAIFIAACMVLIAGSLGVAVYLRFGLTGAESALVALGTLTALSVYNAIAARKHDRLEATNQLANLARGSGDLARQLAEFGRRLNTVEVKTESVIDRALATAQPLSAEIEELSTLVKQLADSVAAHDVALGVALGAERRTLAAAEATPATDAAAPARGEAVPMPPSAAPAPVERKIAAFAGLDRDGIIAAIGRALDASRVDLYLQPVVTLPQRKVR
jgi:cyclic-di-GMP phosphodiesterase TipF (flagellum assembly factor)